MVTSCADNRPHPGLRNAYHACLTMLFSRANRPARRGPRGRAKSRNELSCPPGAPHPMKMAACAHDGCPQSQFSEEPTAPPREDRNHENEPSRPAGHLEVTAGLPARTQKSLDSEILLMCTAGHAKSPQSERNAGWADRAYGSRRAACMGRKGAASFEFSSEDSVCSTIKIPRGTNEHAEHVERARNAGCIDQAR
jgi:hypothetical protein